MTLPRTYKLTFGVYNQDAPWTDVRSLTWPDLTTILCHHEIGPKEGSCVVPATFRGTQRKKREADRIDIALLDSDSGATLEEIRDAISRQGWSAVISSTHSHLTAATIAKRSHWDRFRMTHPELDDCATAFLIEEKRYLPRVASDAHALDGMDEFIRIHHQPCPKFRVAVPLQRPWLAADHTDQNAANAKWKHSVEALAAALNLNHDQACTDTSRLFFLPRRNNDGPPPEFAVVEGRPCDVYALPSASRVAKARAQRSRTEDLSFIDRETGEELDLRDWAKKNAARFQIVAALRTRRPDLFVGKATDGTKYHIRCINEEAHTNAGVDAATFIINASDSSSRGFVYHCRHAHCDGRDRLFFLRRMLERGWLTTADILDPEFQIEADLGRPLIRCIAGKLPEIVDQAENALLRGNLDLYRRGTALVRPGSVAVKADGADAFGAHTILPVEEHALVEAMTLVADWERYDGRSQSWVKMDAPLKVAKTYRQRVGRWKLPVLTGLISAPTLRANGSVLDTKGYDVTTGLLLDTRGTTFPQIPDRPSKSDAIAALSVLKDLIVTFPFVDESGRSVALSAFLTGSIRSSLLTAPLHAFTAPVAGSGKSMLVDLASLIASGRTAGVISQGKTEEELEKRLGALLLAGEPVIAIDNCEAPLGGEFLCAVLSQVRVRTRILGRSEVPELPTNALVTATGNNLILDGDLTRRAVLCRLDPEDERPELRQFSTNPTDLVRTERPRFIAAALIILRAYHVAGRPNQPQSLGSFDDWSNWVRGALIWLECSDPAVSMAEVRRSDPRLNALTTVVTQWEAAIGYTPVSVRALVEKATEPTQSSRAHHFQQFAWPDLRDVLLVIAGEGVNINNRRLGKWLFAQQGRIIEGRKLVRHGVINGILNWRLESGWGPDPEPVTPEQVQVGLVRV